MLRFLVLALLCGGLLSSCSFFRKKPDRTAVKSDFRLSGRIQQVNREAQFVLIRRYGQWKVSDEEIVESRGDGRTANLLPTGEKLGEHIAADIRSGNVEVGDAVYIRRVAQDTKDEEVFTKPEIKPVTRVTSAEPILPEPLPPAPIPQPIIPAPVEPEEEPEDQL